MKHILTCIILAVCLQASKNRDDKTISVHYPPPVQNLFIITIDGFRWQEIFTGADSLLLNDEKFTADTATMKAMYWASSPLERRRRLMPFFWTVLSRQGQLYGNRQFENKVNVSNIYSLSYPGYNEMFTGQTDLAISSNEKKRNPNENVLEYLNHQPCYCGKVAAFTSWNAFPYILNKERSEIMINSGNENGDTGKAETRDDGLTFLTAKEYIGKFKPSIVYLALGETDEMAHEGHYDLYLEKAAAIDQMIAELWHWAQSTPGYTNCTTFLVTTDHGRGRGTNWTKHGFFVNGSSQTWLALIGPNITPLGEMKTEDQVYQKQIAQTIAVLVGKNFQPAAPVASAIAFK